LKKKAVLFGIFFWIVMHPAVNGEEHPVNIQGTYLIYSYDHNQIYGENVTLVSTLGLLKCLYLKVDIGLRLFHAIGDIVLEKSGEIRKGDELIFKLEGTRGTLIRYGETVEIQEIGEASGGSLFSQKGTLDDLILSDLKNSFIFFTGSHFSITDRFEVFGYDVTLYIEGLESVGLKKFRLSEGIRQKQNGFFLDKIWFNRSQGIIGQAGLYFDKEDSFNSITRLSYEEHSILKNYSGLKRQLDLMTSTSLQISDDINLGIIGNFNTSRQWNAQFLMNKNWGERSRSQISFSYNKPLNREGEAWVGLETFLDGSKLGSVSVSGKYEFQDQVLTTFSYGNSALKNFDFGVSASYSKLRVGGSGDYSKILTGSARLSYRTTLFNLSTDYYLNKDLFGNQLLTQPQLRFGFNTFQLYSGLLSATLSNVFIYSDLKVYDLKSNSYSNNSILSLSSQALSVWKSLDLRLSLSLEQFLEKEGRNFTSGGFIINAQQSLWKGVALEGFYSVQSRRKTENWFIEGTTSQDLSLMLRFNPGENLNSWISLSYDPKNNQVRQSFADITIGLIKNWRFHSLFNYDFLLKKLNNVDLYLIRDSGRFQIRLIWRSLSKQFLVELIPK